MSTPVTHLAGNGPVFPRSEPRLSARSRWLIGLLGLVVLSGASIAITHFAQDSLRFPVSNIDILGTVDYVDRDKLKQAVGPQIAKGFYGLDLDDVRESVEQLPWVAHARISRIWPSRLEVRLEEHEPTARWNDDQLISKRLALFSPPQLQLDNPRYLQWRELFAELPQIRGAEGRHAPLVDAYRTYGHELASFGLTLEVLDEDKRGSQTLVLSNQVTVRLGYEKQELRMQRFLDVYERMATKIERQGSISSATFDMRYSNGFALGGVAAEERGDLNNQTTRLVQGPMQ